MGLDRKRDSASRLGWAVEEEGGRSAGGRVVVLMAETPDLGNEIERGVNDGS